jgi:hypothetical protein
VSGVSREGQDPVDVILKLSENKLSKVMLRMNADILVMSPAHNKDRRFQEQRITEEDGIIFV